MQLVITTAVECRHQCFMNGPGWHWFMSAT